LTANWQGDKGKKVKEIKAVYGQGPEAVIGLVEQLCAQIQL
jgi:hypothetical protein